MKIDAIAKLADELRPSRVAKWNDYRQRVSQDDFTCNQCLDFYRDSCACALPTNCYLTSDIQIREKSTELSSLDDNELNYYWYLNDRIAWAKVELDWEPRWYQIQPLRCSSRHIALRQGRQTGKTEELAIMALHHLATVPGSRTVVICPYEDQVNIIFTRIRAFIQKSDLLSDPEIMVRDKMNPHELEFYHKGGNATAIGLTAGVRTGQKGGRLRGQTPSLLIADEADQLDEATLESMLAMLTGVGEKAVFVVSGTPTGRRAHFYKWCTNKIGDFKEFHFKSSVSPNWTKELEIFYRSSYSDNAFAHEFDAEFGELEVGLFQHKFLEVSMSDYSIHNPKPKPDELYSMGVDWNRAGIGVHIVLVGYSYINEMYRVAAKEIISSGEFTQHKAVQRIAELNEIWNPQFIYVDEGDGTTQVEALRLHGRSKPSTGLQRKVKGVNFGSNIMIRDPITKGFVKKAVKPLMVDLCVRRVETLHCIFPKSEDTDTGLVGQMRNFAIKRFSTTGQPVYTQGNDHTLVAWMLGIYGIVIELSDLTKAQSTTKIAFTGPLGQGGSQLITTLDRFAMMHEKDKDASKGNIATIPSRLLSTPHLRSELAPGGGLTSRSLTKNAFKSGSKLWPRTKPVGRGSWPTKRGKRQ